VRERLPCPEKLFALAISQIQKTHPSINNHTAELKIFYFALASSELLIVLRDIVRIHRRSFAGDFAIAGGDLPQAERLKAIKGLNENIAYLGFLRRCHIHRLFVDSSRSSRDTSDGFIINTKQSVSSQKRPKTRNLIYNENGHVSRFILSCSRVAQSTRRSIVWSLKSGGWANN